ncbi:MAG: M48 family metallopeptidase [Planctomycetota bacterium]
MKLDQSKGSARIRAWRLCVFQSVLPAAVVLLLSAGCIETVPITGRKQLALVKSSDLQAMSFEQYGELLKKEKLSPDAQATALVRRVGRRIQAAVERYFADQGLSGRLQGYAWEFNLIDSPEKNAFCMPGGKVAVYTGILPITQDENGLAVVLAHEIAHAAAEHGRERMSRELVASGIGLALDQALQKESSRTRDIFGALYGVGANVGVILPNSRLQESEADRLGLIFMAMAGYDPRGAVALWQRMRAEGSGGAPPVFLSTHPTDDERIRDIEGRLPEALRYYNAAAAPPGAASLFGRPAGLAAAAPSRTGALVPYSSGAATAQAKAKTPSAAGADVKQEIERLRAENARLLMERSHAAPRPQGLRNPHR